MEKWNRVLTADEYFLGLQAIDFKISAMQKRLLIEHCHFPKREATTPDLARAAGASSHSAVILEYVRLARAFCDATGEKPDARREKSKNGKDSWYWYTLWAEGWQEKRGFVWRILPQVAKAIEKLEWLELGDVNFPDDLVSGRAFVEGAARKVVVNAYERNPVARRKCIAFHGCCCCICGFDFGEVYGDRARGYIHVHHIHPLPEAGGEYIVDPIRDLRPVCPNCHAALHMDGGCREIEELKSTL